MLCQDLSLLYIYVLATTANPNSTCPWLNSCQVQGRGGTSHNHCNLMAQKRPWEGNPQTGNWPLGRAPLCQGGGYIPPRRKGLRLPAEPCPSSARGKAQAVGSWAQGAPFLLLTLSLCGDGIWQCELGPGSWQAGQGGRGKVNLPSPGLMSGLPASFLSFLSSRASAKSKSIGFFARKQHGG